jgi:hypothetical protein
MTAKKNKGGASYLDKLGTESARRYAPIIVQQAESEGIPLPLPVNDLEKLLNNTIDALTKEGKMPFPQDLSSVRRQTFITAWYTEMARKGIA